MPSARRVKELLSLGAHDYLTKPYKVDAFLRTVNGHAGRVCSLKRPRKWPLLARENLAYVPPPFLGKPV